ncbi:MAG: CoA ligase [Halothiobacillaceae bacterium]|nr:MAG: CoA ligase [Halothiobacillaceae bacterium]
MDRTSTLDAPHTPVSMAAESRFPLLTHHSPEAVIAYREGKAISVAHFLTDVHHVAERLPRHSHILNTCQDRYHFAVGLAATLLAECVSLMPATLAPEMLHNLRTLFPDFMQIGDEEITTATPSASAHQPHNARLEIPSFNADRLTTWVFTSGSTGAPTPHSKTWGSLVKNVRVEAQRLGMLDGRTHTIIGTVPPQHMYGFESTVLVALQSGCAFAAGRPFYPADICQTIAAVPRPRLLVTTPFHLHALLSAEREIPAVDLVVSATAPLSQNLSQESEARLQAPLLEIYGCTETGQMATRRPAESEQWQLFDGVQLTLEGHEVFVSGGHLDQPVVMQDRVEITHANYFLLQGRAADLINIAGKRSSLAYLNHQLASVAGVIDSTFFMPEEEREDGVTRLTAFVVAPSLTAATLTQALRERIDPAFLPRPLIFVDALPRNATGKLPRSTLIALAQRHALRT